MEKEKRKRQEFIIEEIPGNEDLYELLAMSIVEYINEKYGREVVRFKSKKEVTKVKMAVKVDNNLVYKVRLRG